MLASFEVSSHSVWCLRMSLWSWLMDSVSGFPCPCRVDGGGRDFQLVDYLPPMVRQIVKNIGDDVDWSKDLVKNATSHLTFNWFEISGLSFKDFLARISNEMFDMYEFCRAHDGCGFQKKIEEFETALNTASSNNMMKD